MCKKFLLRLVLTLEFTVYLLMSFALKPTAIASENSQDFPRVFFVISLILK